MIPQFSGRRFFVALVDAEGLKAEDEAANDFDADELDGFRGADNLARDAELGRVYDLEELGRDAEILLDDGGDIVERGVGGIQNFFEAEIGVGRTGKRTEAADDFADLLVGNDGAEIGEAEEKRGERF